MLAQYPELLALLIAVIGLATATVLARWFDRVLTLMESGVRRLSPTRADQFAHVTPRSIIQKVVYYGTIAFFLLLAIRILGISALTDWLDVTLAYLPQVLLGIVIIIVGYLLGILTYGFVSNFLHVGERSLLPRAAQTVVVVTAVMTGLEQMAIDVSFVSNVIVILLATSLSGLAIAFGLGSRDLVANLLAKRNLDRYRIGDTVRIDELQGTIIEFSRTGVALQTTDGIVHVPAMHFVESVVTVIKT